MNTDFLGKDKFIELLVKGGVVNPEEQEREWQKVQLFFLGYFVENSLKQLSEAEKKTVVADAQPDNVDDSKKVMDRLFDFFGANKGKYNLQELVISSGKQAYNKYLETIKEGAKK